MYGNARPYFESPMARLYQADARHMDFVVGESVDCVVTSPPYYGLRRYSGQDDRYIGLESTLELYEEHIVGAMREVWRVLKPWGV